MLRVTCWGTRGSTPVSGPQFMRHGGATTCLEIELVGADGETPRRVVMDCGTGLSAMGRRRPVREALVLQTHMHQDHIQGFPLFGPLFDELARFRFLAARRDGQGLEEVLGAHMARPLFPVPLQALPASLTFEEIPKAGERSFGEARVRWIEVDHPSGSTAFRVDYGGRSVVFSGDVEIGDDDDGLVELSRGADLLIMDAQYLPQEYPSRRGFGHSTPETAVETAMKAGVGRLLLTHHDPGHDDVTLEMKAMIAKQAVARRGGCLVVENARDGLEVLAGAPLVSFDGMEVRV